VPFLRVQEEAFLVQFVTNLHARQYIAGEMIAKVCFLHLTLCCLLSAF
jgi:hypothetical protein